MDSRKDQNTPLKWGLLSTARINRALIKPIRSSERNMLTAVASRVESRAQTYAAQWDIPRAFGSYQAMLDDAEIDVVYISLPNHLHAEWTIKALHAGKHVLCEKPLALSLEEVDAMRAAAEETGNVLAEAFMYRHHPQTVKVKELVDSGEIGTVRMIKGGFTFNLTEPNNIRLIPQMGGGSVWDVGCYPISYARYILGSEPIEAFGWQKTGESGVDEVFAGQLRFANDVLVQFDCGFRSPPRSRILIVGSDATLSVSAPFKPGTIEEIKIFTENEVQTFEILGQELYSGEVEDMTDCIYSGKAPRISIQDSRSNVATILALLQSAKEGSPIMVQ